MNKRTNARKQAQQDSPPRRPPAASTLELRRQTRALPTGAAQTLHIARVCMLLAWDPFYLLRMLPTSSFDFLSFLRLSSPFFLCFISVFLYFLCVLIFLFRIALSCFSLIPPFLARFFFYVFFSLTSLSSHSFPFFILFLSPPSNVFPHLLPVYSLRSFLQITAPLFPLATLLGLSFFLFFFSPPRIFLFISSSISYSWHFPRHLSLCSSIICFPSHGFPSDVLTPPMRWRFPWAREESWPWART